MPTRSDDRPPPGVQDAVASRPRHPKPTTWKHEHRNWLGAQHFDESTSELVYLDLLARVDTLTARKIQLRQDVELLAHDDDFWPTVSRLQSFRAVDSLTALSVHLELGANWQ